MSFELMDTEARAAGWELAGSPSSDAAGLKTAAERE